MSQQVRPRKWKHWRSCCVTNYAVFLGFAAAKPERRVAVGLGDEQGRFIWAPAQPGGDVLSFTFDASAETPRVAVTVAVLEPARTEFIVRTPLR